MMNVLYFALSTFRRMFAVTHMAVLCIVLTLCLPGALLRYFLNDSEMVSFAFIVAGVTCVYTPHALCFYFKVFIF